MKIQCPTCSQKIEVDESAAGQPATCPTCSNEFEIPEVAKSSDDDESYSGDAIKGLIFIIVVVIGVIFLLTKFVSCSKTIGIASGDYEPISAKKLESRAVDYVNKKVEVQMTVGEVTISQSYQRLKIRDYDTPTIDIIVKADSPLYDQIVEIDPKFGDVIVVRGTIGFYLNTSSSFNLVPDQIEFK